MSSLVQRILAFADEHPTVGPYLLLPSERTQPEMSHLKQILPLTLGLLWAHVPVWTLIAWLNNTGPLWAFALTTLAAAGPTLAWVTAEDRRLTSHISAFAGVAMGGLLVHFGQGPLQIEMHFYFFSMLAGILLFANPGVVWTTAIAIAAHHIGLWLVLPTSLFFYDAPFYVVGVHALFVVTESIVCAYIARTFFDKVVHAETLLAARTAELDLRNASMRQVLDHVHEGLLTLNAEGRIGPEQSSQAVRWLGGEAGDSFLEVLEAHDPYAANCFAAAWENVGDGFLPYEVAIDQLPKKVVLHVSHGHRTLSIAYIVLPEHVVDDVPQQILIVLTDATDALARARAEQLQRDLLEVIQRIGHDRSAFEAFADETDDLLEALGNGSLRSPLLVRRGVHTLKGNAGLFGLTALVDACHTVESEIDALGELPPPQDLKAIERAWHDITRRLSGILGQHGDVMNVRRKDHQKLLDQLRAHADHEHLAHQVERWRLQSVEQPLERLADQGATLAERLGKGPVQTVVQAGDLRVPSKPFRSFWQALTHVLRNAVDHGLETADQRKAVGKTEPATLTFRAHVLHAQDGAPSAFVVELSDNGQGIAWDRIRDKAASLGLRHATRPDLIEALFSDGMTTRDQVTTLSGRGVGTAAVLASVQHLGGRIEVDSEPGQGTTFRFLFPARLMEEPPTPAPVSA